MAIALMLGGDCEKDRSSAGIFQQKINGLDSVFWMGILPGELNQAKERSVIIYPGPAGRSPVKLGLTIVPIPHVFTIDDGNLLVRATCIVNEVCTDERALGTARIVYAILKEVQPRALLIDGYTHCGVLSFCVLRSVVKPNVPA